MLRTPPIVWYAQKYPKGTTQVNYTRRNMINNSFMSLVRRLDQFAKETDTGGVGIEVAETSDDQVHLQISGSPASFGYYRGNDFVFNIARELGAEEHILEPIREATHPEPHDFHLLHQ